MTGSTIPMMTKSSEDEIEVILARYLDEEREIYKITDPRVIQLAGSRSFNSNGFPHACLTKRNIGYYLDSQQENRALWYMQCIGNIDEATAGLLKDALHILTKTNAETVGAGGGVSGLVHGLYCALNARKLLPRPQPDQPVYTLEIGPGSGWTTYFLTRFGYHTTTIDSNPNLIATQNYLMSWLPPDCAGRYTQLPWWKFYDIHYKVPHQFDMVLANHMICEISQWSRLYIAKWCSLHLTSEGVVFFQAWGNEDFHSRFETLHDFQVHDMQLYAQSQLWFLERSKWGRRMQAKLGTFGCSKKGALPEINLLKKNQEKSPRFSYVASEEKRELSRAFTARAKRKLYRIFNRGACLIHNYRRKILVLEYYSLASGVPVTQIVCGAGFTDSSFANPSFRWSKICH